MDMGDIVEELDPNVESENTKKKVEIVLKTIGPARPSRLLVPSSIKVLSLFSTHALLRYPFFSF